MRYARSVCAAFTTRKLWRIVLMLLPISLLLLWPSRGLRAQSGHSITLTWAAATTGTTPTGYNVKRGTAAGTEATIGSTTTPTTTYVDTTGTAGVTYFYVVTATNAQASPPESAPSNEVSATFLPLPALAAPVELAAVSK